MVSKSQSVAEWQLAGFNQQNKEEINSHISYLHELEVEATLAPIQQNILKSTTYLMLYNYVEALHCKLVQRLSDEASGFFWNQYTPRYQKLWISSRVRPPYTDRKISDVVVDLAGSFRDVPLEFELNHDSGGNFGDDAITGLGQRFGINLKFPRWYCEHGRPAADETALNVIKERRNALAHGDRTFADFSSNVTAGELRTLADESFQALEVVQVSWGHFIEGQKFLVADA